MKKIEEIKTTDSENNIITYIFSLNIYNLITYILLKNTPPKKDESEIVSQVNFKILNNIKKWESSDKTPYDLLEIVFNSKIMNLEVGKALQLDIAKEFPPNNELSESDLTIIDTVIKNFKARIEKYREQLQIAQADYNDYGRDENAFIIGKPIRDEAKENAKNMIENELLTGSITEKKFKDTYYAFQKKIGELTVTEKFYKLATQDLDSQTTNTNDGELKIELKNFIRFNKMLSENKMYTLRAIFDVSKCRIEGNTLILEEELTEKFIKWKDIVPESKTDRYKNRVNGLSVGDMCNKEKLEALINDANSKST